MSFFKRYKIKRILTAATWVVISCGAILLLAASVKKNDIRKCEGINIKIYGASNHFFIDQSDIKKIIANYSGNDIKNKSLKEFDLRTIERVLERDIWVNNAELFFDTEGVLQVMVDEREPVARIFTKTGNTFYIDSSLMMLPLSDKFSARVPVFTNFPTDTKIMTKADRRTLVDVRTMASAINEDPFLMGMIDQVNISDREFELYPKMGDQVILFGDAEDHEKKFKKLKLFYKNIISKTGWEKYSIVNLKFNNQVVAKLRSKEEVIADSLQTLKLMKALADYTQSRAGDTLFDLPGSPDIKPDESMIMQSIQRDEPTEVNILGLTDNSEEKNIKTKTLVNSANLTDLKRTDSKPVAAPSHENVKKDKPVVINNEKRTVTKPITKPILKPTVKPSIKPAKKNEAKPALKKPETKTLKPDLKHKQVPKAVMPKQSHETHTNNDY